MEQQNLTQQSIDELKEKFLNKRVSIEDGDGHVWVGELIFIGYNSFFPSWGLCATLNRTPIQHVKVESIHLRPFTKTIFNGK